jgi:phenylpropionate dioxygenase-like ring-hydroxylating dioxygenase large terminal subunit
MPSLNRDLARAGQAFVHEAWYLAAWSDELGEAPLGLTLLGEGIVLFRKSDGSPVALEDRCAHRSLPLSIGRVRGDLIECGYHGLRFDACGRCVHAPGQAKPPPGAIIRAYPAVEQDRCIWVWTGAPEPADPAKITRFPWMAKPGWRHTKLHARIAANYQLIIDNLLDLSHLSFVHSTTVGSPELAEAATVKTERTDDGVTVSRWTLDVAPAPTYAQFGKYDCNVDRWQISRWFVPSTLVIRNGSAKAGTGAPETGGGEQRWEFVVCHGVTPESDRTTNYFWAVTHDFLHDDPLGAEEFHRQSHQVIGEDIAVFTAQQSTLERWPQAPVVDIRYDAGPLQARRMIDARLTAEARTRGKDAVHVSA